MRKLKGNAKEISTIGATDLPGEHFSLSLQYKNYKFVSQAINMAEELIEQKVKRLEEWRNNFFGILIGKYTLEDLSESDIPGWWDELKRTNEKLAKAQADIAGLINWTDANHEQCIIWKQKSWEDLMYEDGYYHNCVWHLHR